jgi:hypothetical protein
MICTFILFKTIKAMKKADGRRQKANRNTGYTLHAKTKADGRRQKRKAVGCGL